MMRSDTKLALVALGIWMGEIKIGDWERRVTAKEFREALPDVIVSNPHLREMGLDIFYNRYCYGLDPESLIAENSGGTDRLPRAYWTHYMLSKVPDMKDEMLERLKGYKSRTYLLQALEEDVVALDAAKALLELDEDPERLPQELECCRAIIAKFPKSEEAKKASSRIDSVLAKARGLRFSDKFLEDLLYNHPEYSDRAYEITESGGCSDNLLKKIALNPPKPEMQGKAAERLCTRDENDISWGYWRHMGGASVVYANVPSHRRTASEILQQQAPRTYLAKSMQSVPKNAGELFDAILRRDEKDVGDKKRQEEESRAKEEENGRRVYGRRFNYPVLSSTDVAPYFQTLTEFMNDGADEELAARLGRYIAENAGSEYMVGHDKRNGHYADVIVHPHVDEETRKIAWENAKEAGCHGNGKIVAAQLPEYSVEAARAILEGDWKEGFKIVMENMGTLAPNLQLQAGRQILQHSSVTNEDMDLVVQLVPALAAEVNKRPAHEDIVAKIRASVAQV
ncbi:hypothetical protein H6770_03660 [Candidatus Peribacteria bacterium]|nr:hypothetical protein [Candidatus Peribacteria bacterium]